MKKYSSLFAVVALFAFLGMAIAEEDFPPPRDGEGVIGTDRAGGKNWRKVRTDTLYVGDGADDFIVDDTGKIATAVGETPTYELPIPLGSFTLYATTYAADKRGVQTASYLSLPLTTSSAYEAYLEAYGGVGTVHLDGTSTSPVEMRMTVPDNYYGNGRLVLSVFASPISMEEISLGLTDSASHTETLTAGDILTWRVCASGTEIDYELFVSDAISADEVSYNYASQRIPTVSGSSRVGAAAVRIANAAFRYQTEY